MSELVTERLRRRDRRRSADGRVRAVDRDEGSALVLALAMIVVCGLMVLPILEYAQAVSSQSRVLQVKTTRIEAVKGGLRTALADPVSLYKVCDAAGLTVPRDLASPGLTTAVSTRCWKMDSTHAEDPDTLRYGVGTTRVGALPPGGTIGSPMPSSGGAPANQWRSDTTPRPADDRMWLPLLPSRSNSLRSPIGFSMPAGYPPCTVYFPGTYQDPVVITGSTPVFFTSGVYYFERDVRFSGSANVVIGGGGNEGCTNDQEAAFYAVGAPTVHNISGLGTTFVFGREGRLVVDTTTAGTGPSVVFNQRYVGPADVTSASSAGVSIMTVNGELSGSTLVDLERADTLSVPAGQIATDPPSPATAEGYRPSTLVPGAITGTQGRYVRVQLASTTDPLNLAEVRVNGLSSSNVPGELAQGKPATQSTTEGPAVAARAVDGNTSGLGADGSLSSTGEADEPNPWWQVEIGPSSTVHEVVLHNRTDPCCAARLQNFTVFVSQTDMTGRTYADLLADPAIIKVTQAAAAGPVTTIPFTTSTAAVPAPVVEVNLTTAVPVRLAIPGHVSVPQGRVVVTTAPGTDAGKDVSIGGGVLASSIEVSPVRPATFELGLVNPIVMHTLKIVTSTTGGTPVVTSTAIVQVKENGAYAVNSWSTQ
ncbi:MAG: hypothetical protein F2534_00250 [Actinobacteria bacterium]|uniref:Unannotated protein n=1 Tax=freshwater metagenome TaxID=449393 RepID=A0A6J6BD25_9ZZZZ|nr:hypothetical protein [Actinomycetota bacterium]